jgi:anion-transporting  ArsA/GET3 family ATPase
MEWLRTLGGRFSTRLLAASSTFQYFAAAAPGAKELVSLIKLRELCESRRARGDRERYDLAILDAAATGHALAMLRSPQTFAAIVRGGPLAEQAKQVRELLEDPDRSGYVAVAQATEMSVAETLELEQGLRRHLDRGLDMVLVNGAMPKRFTRDELELIAKLDGNATGASATTGAAAREPDAPAGQPNSASRSARDTRVVHSAAQMARAAHERARVQQSQIARLRRRRVAVDSTANVVRIPFVFNPELDLAAVRRIADRLERHL